MALSLALTATQSNDATYLTVTDSTGETAATGWGVGGNEDYPHIVISTDTTTGSRYHLLLTVAVEDKDANTTTYDAINLYNKASDDGTTVPFAALTDLVWTLDAADLIDNSVAMATSSDRMTDGLYTLTYSLVLNSNHSTVSDTYEVTMLVDGDVRADVYDALREISNNYDNEINDESDEIMEALLKYSYLQAMEASATVALSDEIISMLYTLNKLNSDGSKYSW